MSSSVPLPADAQRVIADLRELAALTSTSSGAQRVAWGPIWRQARDWFAAKVAGLGLTTTSDSAGNRWVIVPGQSSRTVIIGGHIDSVPNGGWLDGSLDLLAGLEVLRRYGRSRPPVTIAVVDWADEEGARFGRSLLGSSAAGGSLDVDDVRALTDKEGTKLVDALRENGVELDTMLQAHQELKAIDAKAYLELHIEQGPVLEATNKSAGVVLGTLAWSATWCASSARRRTRGRRRSPCDAMRSWPQRPPRSNVVRSRAATPRRVPAAALCAPWAW